MAKNFLLLSPAYVEKMDVKLLQRREVVVAALTDKYKVVKGQGDEIFRHIQVKLAEEGLIITAAEYKEDKTLYRGLYRWLRATDDDDREDALGSIRKFGALTLEFLKQDGIQSWTDVRRVWGEDPTGPSEDEEDESSKGALTREAIRAKARTSETGVALAARMQDFFTVLDPILVENEEFKAEIARLGEENTELRRNINELRALYELSENQVASLEAQVRTAKDSVLQAHRIGVEALARKHPEIPELLTAVQRLAKQPARQSEREILLKSLPQEFSWRSDRGRVTYQESFLREALRLREEERQQVIRQVGMLAAQGAEYTSLQTRKYPHGAIPFSPTPCWSSRAADDLRFSWAKSSELTIYWLWRKGGSHLRQSEG